MVLAEVLMRLARGDLSRGQGRNAGQAPAKNDEDRQTACSRHASSGVGQAAPFVGLPEGLEPALRHGLFDQSLKRTAQPAPDRGARHPSSPEVAHTG
jgi:hypothetical protein